ncbi:MAG: bifunctional [glutamine synthetase] adenylyltransferase/[glutamine synthetase]-adenylyl-L-tyrosine phosphorylase [Pseudomonadota bacterium]
MTSFMERVSKAPLAHDQDRADATMAQLDPGLRAGKLGALLTGASGSSPYLSRLISRHADWLADTMPAAPEDVLDALLDALNEDITPDTGFADVARALRVVKSRAALLIALADLGGVWTLQPVTDALTRVADTTIEQAARWLLQRELAGGKLPGLDEDALAHGAGYIVLAMGKLGAHELNYSSDIDLIVLFDEQIFEDSHVQDARARYIHVTRQLVKLLSENTGDGYVFRTDLRLRPAPSTTPICMSTEAAERYYETIGRTWERAAHIKARPLVDTAAGGAYLRRLSPFIWRRNLDFAAIEDVHALLRKIRAQRVRFTPDGLAGYDLKLGPGGIREIEFFAQTRQLIMGGRDPTLRPSETLNALTALERAGLIDLTSLESLSRDYIQLRTIEHRLQMIEDAQTHAVPKSVEARERVARLAGQSDLQAFERNLADLLERVHTGCEEFFGTREAPRDTESDQITEDHLLTLGFKRPTDALRTLARWTRGEIAATRAERAQGLLSGLQSAILQRLAGAIDPDRALVQFDRFIAGLPSGVQVFSLFSANPQLLDLIVEICSAAPRLAAYLARHPHTLDALLDHDFWQPLPERSELEADLRQRLAGISDYERILDATRVWAREQWFRVGVHVLRSLVDPVEAGAEFSRIAECYIAFLVPVVIADFASRHGAPPGVGLTVLAMGKLGSCEMTARSDLDLITIFDDAGVEMSDGPKALGSGIYYRRLTQALVSALTAPTAEGALYEVDMRLRPSGRSGPVAVSVGAFERYQTEDAWVWEHMALTRARVVAGPEDLSHRVGRIAKQALAKRVADVRVMPEARDMRMRLIDAHGPDRANPWSLKHTAGGLMEIEFLAQVGALLTGIDAARPLASTLSDLADHGWISAEDAATLKTSARLQQSLQQIERVALDGTIDPETVGAELRQALVRASEAEDFGTLLEQLTQKQQSAGRIVEQRLGLEP